jgi:glutathione S-transferase
MGEPSESGALSGLEGDNLREDCAIVRPRSDSPSFEIRTLTQERTMLKIFGHPMSTCTRKVLMTAEETGTAYDFTTVDFGSGQHKQQPHVGRQPFGQVPALEDGGFAMYESRAMSRYLDEKAGGILTPKSMQGRAKMEQWMSVETSNFSPHAMKFIYADVFMRPQEPSVIEAATKGLETALGVLDAQLAKTPFLVGDAFTLADVCYMPYLEYLALTPAKAIVAKYPHVSAWWAKISERPSWRKVAGRA